MKVLLLPAETETTATDPAVEDEGKRHWKNNTIIRLFRTYRLPCPYMQTSVGPSTQQQADENECKQNDKFKMSSAHTHSIILQLHLSNGRGRKVRGKEQWKMHWCSCKKCKRRQRRNLESRRRNGGEERQSWKRRGARKTGHMRCK